MRRPETLAIAAFSALPVIAGLRKTFGAVS